MIFVCPEWVLLDDPHVWELWEGEKKNTLSLSTFSSPCIITPADTTLRFSKRLARTCTFHCLVPAASIGDLEMWMACYSLSTKDRLSYHFTEWSLPPPSLTHTLGRVARHHNIEHAQSCWRKTANRYFFSQKGASMHLWIWTLQMLQPLLANVGILMGFMLYIRT